MALAEAIQDGTLFELYRFGSFLHCFPLFRSVFVPFCIVSHRVRIVCAVWDHSEACSIHFEGQTLRTSLKNLPKFCKICELLVAMRIQIFRSFEKTKTVCLLFVRQYLFFVSGCAPEGLLVLSSPLSSLRRPPRWPLQTLDTRQLAIVISPAPIHCRPHSTYFKRWGLG